MTTNNAKNEPTGTSGKVMQGQGIGTASSLTVATYPSTATGTGKLLRADGTNYVASTATYPDTAGANTNVLTSDGTNWSSSAFDSSINLAKGTLTNAQIKSIRATPIAIVAAPGAGKVLVPIFLAMTMNYGGTNVFTSTDGTIQIQYPGPFPAGVTACLSTTAITANVSKYGCINMVSISTKTLSSFSNKSLSLANGGTAEITGNAANNNTMSYELLYYIMTP
jgi:hypothetical protein